MCRIAFLYIPVFFLFLLGGAFAAQDSPLKTGANALDSLEVVAYDPGQAPLVRAAPFQETVVSLEPGEKFTHISSGDPSRWSYTVAVSGSASPQQHILIKPSVENSTTNLVIATDRRLYTLRLLASPGSPARTLRFYYPQDTSPTVAASPSSAASPKDTPLASIPSVPLHFNYRLSRSWFSKAPVWKPVRVFDDGARTYIEFPKKALSRDLPAFFVCDDPGQLRLANYRLRAPYAIVDGLFDRAVLIMGVGRRQVRVTVTHT